MIFVLTGPIHSGKTTFLKKLAEELRKEGLNIEGYLSIMVKRNQEIRGYDLFDLKEKESMPFIRREGEEEWERVGSYFFIPEGLVKARIIISQSKEADILVVDEVGPLELSGKGLWPVLKKRLLSPHKIIILVVRESILQDFLILLRGKRTRIFDIQKEGTFSIMKKEIRRNV